MRYGPGTATGTMLAVEPRSSGPTMPHRDGLFERVDTVAVVEAVYAEAADTEQWLGGLIRAMGPGIEHVATMASVFSVAGSTIVEAVIGSHGLSASELTVATAREVGPFTKAWKLCPLVMASAHSAVDVKQFGASQLLRGHGVEPADYVSFTAFDPVGRAISLAFALPRVAVPTAKDQRRAAKLAAHISAGYRLRSRQAVALSSALDAAAAILNPDGKLLHAEGPAKAPSAGTSLRQAARDIDQARSKQGRVDTDLALETWRALVSGTWSLVDFIDSDGRRLLVARENAPVPPPAERLSTRERQVVAYAVVGQSQKLIAYTLGLSVSAVSTHLASACRKLGVASRAQLTAALGWGKAVGATLPTKR